MCLIFSGQSYIHPMNPQIIMHNLDYCTLSKIEIITVITVVVLRLHRIDKYIPSNIIAFTFIMMLSFTGQNQEA